MSMYVGGDKIGSMYVRKVISPGDAISYNDLTDKPFIPSAVTDLSDATNYALKAEIKTVNGNSLIGSGNLDIDGLPSQTGNSGKFLTTNGTSASWATVSTPSEVEWATYGTTTYQQIKEWNDEGKIVFCTHTSIIYRLVQVASSLYCEFTSLFNNGIQTRILRVDTSNNWSYNNVVLQKQIPAGTSGNILTYTGTAGSVGSATINDIVPSQTGNSGKFLTTNGSAVSWATVSIPTVDQTYNGTSANAQSGAAINNAKFLRNTATGTSSISIDGGNVSNNFALSIGGNGNVGAGGIAIGSGATASGDYAIAIGTAIPEATGQYSIAIGRVAKATANYAIQLGKGENSEANSFYVATSDSNNYKILGSDGKIPDDRLSTNIARTSDYYTKAEIDEMLGNIEAILQRLNSGNNS